LDAVNGPLLAQHPNPDPRLGLVPILAKLLFFRR
jgi:hypothetical protein